MIKKVILLFLVFLFSTVPVLAATINFYDIYTTNPSTYTDGKTWLDTDMKVALLGPPSGTHTVCWDWDGDEDFSECFGITSDIVQMCAGLFSDVSEVCNKGGCSVGNPSAWHDMWVNREGENAVGPYGDGNPILVKYFTNCDELETPEEGEPTNNGVEYYILSDREYICDSKGGTYSDKGYYGEGRWITLTSSTSCSANYGCDIRKDEGEADFGYYGTDVPSSPCSKLNGQSCSADKDCVNYCSPDNVCVEHNCGDGVCENDEWCAEDPCPTCGGGTCNTCDADQCPSYPWQREGVLPYCFDNGDLCCPGDDTDSNPDTIYGQYYCKNNEDWALCTYDDHHLGEHYGEYYCTYENGNWRWRRCPTGCCTGTTCHPPATPQPIIDVTPSTLTFEVGY